MVQFPRRQTGVPTGYNELDEREWWSQTESNRRPLACHASALPTELWPHIRGSVAARGPLPFWERVAYSETCPGSSGENKGCLVAEILTFLPGTMCDQRLWAPVWQRLIPRFSCDYVPTETQPTREGMLGLIHSAASVGEPLNLVAFSMGGYLALEYALANPGQVASLVTIGSSAFGLTDQEKADRFVEDLVELVEAQRAFDLASRAVRTQDQLLEMKF